MLIPQHASSATPSATLSSCDASTEVGFQFKPLLVKEVESALNVTHITGAVNSDDISGHILKISCEKISLFVKNIFNTSFPCRLFPTAWKKAVVTLVYKKGCQYYINNYRPIAIVPILYRVFERLLYVQLRNYLENDNLLSCYRMTFVQLFRVRWR